MAELRCPMCSRLNPDDLEFCQFCDARLKPLIGSSQENPHHIKAGEKPTKRQTAEFEKVKLGSGTPIRSGEQPTRKDTGELERSLPSWLRSLRESGDQPPAEPPEEPKKKKSAPEKGSSGESLDWLEGLESAGEEEEGEFPQWLAGLRSASGAEPGDLQVPEPKASKAEPDWLDRLGGEAAKPPPPPPPAKAAEAAPDWLSRLEAETTSTPPIETKELKPLFGSKPTAREPAAKAAPAEKVPDWLEELKSKAGTFEETPAAGKEEAPGWLSNLPSIPPEKPAAEPADQPDWLSSLKGIVLPQEPAGGAPAQPTPADETPDWLRNLPGAEAPAAEEVPAQPISDAETPDWLRSLKGIRAQEEAPAQPTPAEETPDWLRNLPTAQAPASEEPPAQPISETETPDWLSSLKARAMAADAERSPAPPPSSEETPNWLSGLPAAASAPASSVFVGGQAAERETPAEVPDWLSKLQSDVSEASKEEKRAEEFEPAEPLPVEKSSEPVPDWLSNIEQTAAPSAGTPALVMPDGDGSSAASGKAAFSLETPDWLSKLRPDRKTEPTTSPSEEPSSESLEAAELPSWVQAMRPVESVVPDAGLSAPEDLGTAEASGPLAGLHSVLPSTPFVGAMRKPASYGVKLQASSNQQRYAAQLEKMVVEEGQARVRKQERFISSRMWRLVISLVLILAVVFPLVSGVTFTPDVNMYPSEWGETSRLLDEFPADAAVLLVFDYDPALSGELEAAAAPIIDHILYRGVRLAMISTSPTGPALAGQFLEDTQKYHLDTGLQYTNLGYLAGGPAGIQLFAADPRMAVTRDVEGNPAWDTPTLQGVSKLSDFAAVMVMTDNADTGRNWIEQTASAIGDTPLLMVISAQAEPMIRPYYDSGQIKGLVTGLMGGKVYEQTYATPGRARLYWDSFGFGTLAAVILIIIGSALGAFTGMRKRRKK